MKKLWLLLLLAPSLAYAGASRDFDGTGDWMENLTTPAVTAYPVTAHCWINRDTPTDVVHVIFGYSDIDVDNVYNHIRIQNTGFLATEQRRNTSTQQAAGDATSAGTWHSILGIDEQTAGTVFLDAGGKDTNTNSSDFPSPDNSHIGRLNRVTASSYWDGQIAFCSHWTSDLENVTGAFAELLAGMWPSWVDTGNIRSLYTLINEGSTEPDYIGSDDMTNQGSTESDSGPPVFFPIGGM